MKVILAFLKPRRDWDICTGGQGWTFKPRDRPLTPGAQKSGARECLQPSGSDADPGTRPRPRQEPLRPRPPNEQHINPSQRGPTGAAGAAPGGAAPFSAPERGAQRATARVVGRAENGRLRSRRAPGLTGAPWFGGPDTGSPDPGALTRAARPQKVGGIEGRALETRAL
ncbi:hypothetical protein NDU88_004995 [Pleurodeles waltl]|uniref:Uncharacterized protein n=1 Tax=Pleurodeles waltl TaxID=8319 RepID=A0AAV7NML9_PLEWA|nr:hypothetical protein NDU88_004995 [Pleurodeles waltl]